MFTSQRDGLDRGFRNLNNQNLRSGKIFNAVVDCNLRFERGASKIAQLRNNCLNFRIPDSANASIIVHSESQATSSRQIRKGAKMFAEPFFVRGKKHFQ